MIVEGASDKVALDTLARRRGRNLEEEGVYIAILGGAHAIRNFLQKLRADDRSVKLAGLCDQREEADFRRALEESGLGSNLSRQEMERLGFYVCETDLEDELIRSLGPEAVEKVIEAQGELRSYRSLQRQPFQRDRTTVQHLRRFMSTRAGRKATYARALVEALDLDHVPRPLDCVLAHISQ